MAPSVKKAAVVSVAGIAVSVAVAYQLLKSRSAAVAVGAASKKKKKGVEEPGPAAAKAKDVTKKAFSLKSRKPVDEEALLTAEDNEDKKVTAVDCSTSRRACKNCVCGRAEMEAKADAEGVPLEFQMPSGGCGNCAKGDAFRCAGCPSRGKPAWNADEKGKVTLDLTDDY